MSIGNTKRGVFNNILKFLNIVFNPLLDSRFVTVNDSGTFNKEPMTITKPKIVKMTKTIRQTE